MFLAQISSHCSPTLHRLVGTVRAASTARHASMLSKKFLMQTIFDVNALAAQVTLVKQLLEDGVIGELVSARCVLTDCQCTALQHCPSHRS